MQQATSTYVQFEHDAPRFYDYAMKDFTRAQEAALSRSLHIWLLSDREDTLRRRSAVSVFSQYGVVTDHSFYCPIFTRTMNGLLWVACPCEAGRFCQPCYHVPGALNFHLWREEAGLVVLNSLEGAGRPGGHVRPRRYTC